MVNRPLPRRGCGWVVNLQYCYLGTECYFKIQPIVFGVSRTGIAETPSLDDPFKFAGANPRAVLFPVLANISFEAKHIIQARSWPAPWMLRAIFFAPEQRDRIFGSGLGLDRLEKRQS